MKRIFLDTNILLDVFLERDPFCGPAQIIWSLAEKREIQAAISALSISNIFFIIKKLSTPEKAYAALETLTQIFQICDVSSRAISWALRARFHDFEVAIQYHSALKFKARAIISRDPSGFIGSKIPVLDSAQYLSLLKST